MKKTDKTYLGKILGAIIILISGTLVMGTLTAYTRDKDAELYLRWRKRLIQRHIISKRLTNYIYSRILYWQTQPKPKPTMIDKPILNKG